MIFAEVVTQVLITYICQLSLGAIVNNPSSSLTPLVLQELT